MKSYYVYRHIRLDKNTPFYIGVGTIQPSQRGLNKFNRAFKKIRRSAHWNNVVSKTDYEVEILLISNDKDLILQKEIEFINLYKRTCDGGTLVNKSTGGEFSGFGVIPTQSELDRRSSFFKKYWKENVNPKSHQIFQYDLNGNLLNKFQSVRRAGIELEINCKTISFYLKSHSKSSLKKGWLFSKNELSKESALSEISRRQNINKFQNTERPTFIGHIDQFDSDGTYIKTWNSVKEITLALNCLKNGIYDCINGKLKTSNGFVWKLSDD